MALLQNSIVPAAAASDEEVVTRSLRFEDDAYLSFTPSSATSTRQKAVINFWFKIAEPESSSARYCVFFSAGNVQGSGTEWFGIHYNANTGKLHISDSMGVAAMVTTDAVYRDYGSWYNLHLILDSTQSTSTDRLKLYINGELQSLTGTYPTLNQNFKIGTAAPHRFGYQDNSPYHGTTVGPQVYIANAYVLENSTLPYTDFIEDTGFGSYKPKATSGLTFGNNGFHLKFEDSDTAFIGFDSSLNGAVSWNTSKYRTGGYGTPTWSESNAQFDGVSGNVQHTMSNYEGSGKYYAEFEFTGGTYSSDAVSGVGAVPAAWWTGSTLNSYMYSNNDAARKGCAMVADEVIHVPLNTNNVDCSGTGSEPHFTVGTDRIGIEVDGTANTAIFYRVNSSEKVQIASLNNSTHGIDFGGKVAWGCTIHDGNHSIKGYFAQSDWLQSPSTGYVEMPAGNHFTATNFDSSDVLPDRPSNNYATLNPLDTNGGTFSEGNLKWQADGNHRATRFTQAVPDGGKVYFEVYFSNASGNNPAVGLMGDTAKVSDQLNANPSRFIRSNGYEYNNGSESNAGNPTWSSGDIVGVAVDLNAGELKFRVNNGSFTTAFNDLGGTKWLPALKAWESSHYYVLNAGADPTFAGNKTSGQDTSQSEFYYAPPSGFKALCTANLDDPTVTPHENFAAVTYSGNSTARTIDMDFTPNLTWIKRRDSTAWHYIADSERGFNSSSPSSANVLASNDSASENTSGSGFLEAFNSSGGFDLGSNSATNWHVNITGQNYVAWNWKESATAGMDIVTWTGNSANTYGSSSKQTVSHSLGVAPDMIIAKARTDDSGNYAGSNLNWVVWHKDLSSDRILNLNNTYSQSQHEGNLISGIGTSSIDFGNDLSWSYETLNIDYSDYGMNADTYVAYLFSSVEGYSKAFSLSSSSDAFCYLGFRPAFLIIKRIDSAQNWLIFDNKREGYNVDNNIILPNSSASEYTTDYIDILSNGFKVRTTQASIAAGTLVGLAFAESPLKHANAR